MSTGPPESTTPKSPPTRYGNKDGSKFITVPRKPTSPEPVARPSSPRFYFSSQGLPAMDDRPPPIMDFSTKPSQNNGTTTNSSKKKKKKKSKGQSQQSDALREAPQYLDPQSSFTSPLQLNNSSSTAIKTSDVRSHAEYQQHIKASLAQFEPSDPDPDDIYDSEDGAQYEQHYTSQNGQPEAPPPAGKKKNKKKKKKSANPEGYSGGGDSVSGSIGGARPGGNNNPPARKGKDRIWNTSTNEERERIKEFWLSLGEDDRRSLVKVEKEAVLKKMKEQQKHSCSCSVCGRKRTAIEEELEVLYDAYYEELEQYANQQQSKFASPIPPHFATRGPPPSPLGASQTGIEELDDDDDGFEDEYEDDDGEDDEIVEDEPLPEMDSRSEFFAFGNSLTVKGGILTVADDLLKNDGKKFIEMMEQLAERRMQREEEANTTPNGHLNMTMTMSSHGAHSNNHPTQTQEYDDEDEDEEDYPYDDDEDDEDDEEDDEPDMSEEQRMEEGRRMFQIFAARMFEQRVLQAYREKVAQERQRKLLEELEEETRLKEEREQRRVKEKERKKDRKRQQKLAKEEERLKREAEKAAEEAAMKAIEDKKAEEARKRKEELRQKKEAERRAAEEERQRKEEEKKKRQQEEREREIERERKRKEHQERERKKKEDAARKAKEEKEIREKEAREKREREERERRVREAKAKKAAEEEKIRKEESEKRAAATAIAVTALAAARAQQPTPNQYNSPHGTIATPAVPKQPTNAQTQARPRQASQQESVGSSPKTPQVLPRLGLAASPNTPTTQQSMPGPQKTLYSQTQFSVNHMNSPLLHTPHTMGPPPGVPSPHSDASSYPLLSSMNVNGPGPFLGNMSQRGSGMPMYMPQGPVPISNPQYRGFANTNGLPMPLSPAPGLRPGGQNNRGLFTSDFGGLPLPLGSPIPNPGLPMYPPNSPFPMGRTDTLPSIHSHGRQPSGAFEDRTIHRSLPQPTPIQRPQSTKSDDLMNSKALVDDLSSVLGSRALIDDEGLEVHYSENVSPSARRGSSLFGSRPGMGFGGIFDPMGNSWSAQGKDIFSSSPIDWGHMPIHQPLNSWTNGAGWSDKDTPRRRRGETRLDQIRLLACKVCQELSGPAENKYHERNVILKAMAAAAPREIQLPISQRELEDLVEVEGDIQNGGGVFLVDRDQQGNHLIKFEPSDAANLAGKPNPAAGEIGSPSIIGSFPVSGSGFAGASIPPMMGPPPGIGTMPVGSVGSVGSGASGSGSGGTGMGGGGSGSSGGMSKFGTGGNNANQFMT